MVERMKMARQPNSSATMLATGRASRMPSSRPLMMLPTTRPRIASGHICAAIGIRICAATELMPISSAANRKTPAFGATAAIARATTVPDRVSTTSRRFSTMSASGTSRISPTP